MPVLNSALLYPMFAMFLLTVIVLMKMFMTRSQAVKSGQVKMSYFKTYTQTGGPDKMLQASRHFSNLFEAPVLFYAVCILGILFSEGYLFLVLAWLYVLARVIHAIVHLGTNRMIPRMSSYGLGWLALIALWTLLVFHQLFPVVLI